MRAIIVDPSVQCGTCGFVIHRNIQKTFVEQIRLGYVPVSCVNRECKENGKVFKLPIYSKELEQLK